MDDKRCSVRLFKILEGIGASEKMRRRHLRTATLLSAQETIYYSNKGVYWCGSRYEGTVTPGLKSDADIVSCADSLPVMLDYAASPSGLSLLIVSDSWTYPGYAKLQFVVDGKVQFSSQNMGPTLFVKPYNIDNAGRICLKHHSIENRHGPANMDFGMDGEHIFDTVWAHRCKNLTPTALGWMMRPRSYDWPSEDQLQKMKSMGCMLVAAVPKHSSERKKDEIEWRLSYTRQEMFLMASLNPVQHKVYILLKMINKDLIRPHFEGRGLTSYHWKTCILYAVEMTPAHVWTQDNLINCLLQCLKLMTMWLQNEHCPSYFCNDANLFAKAGFKKCRVRLLVAIRELVESKHQFLYELQCDNVGAVLRDGDWGLYRDITIEKKNKYKFDLMFQQLGNYHKYIIIYIKVAGAESKDDNLSLSSASLRDFHVVTESDKTAAKAMGYMLACLHQHEYEDRRIFFILHRLMQIRAVTESDSTAAEAMRYIMAWLNLLVAKGFASLAYAIHDMEYQQRLAAEMAHYFFHEAREADVANERLAVASVLFANKRYSECFRMLQQLEERFTWLVHSLCPCGKYLKRLYPGDQKLEHRVTTKMALNQYATNITACCVRFLPYEAAIAPEPLQYEMRRSLDTPSDSRNDKEHYWFDWAVVDARVYLHFLQYRVSDKLELSTPKQEARLKIRDVIETKPVPLAFDQFPYHKDTAYNLLGWIHMQEQHLAEAFLCFAESWKIRPHHNAAKFHMADWLKRVNGN